MTSRVWAATIVCVVLVGLVATVAGTAAAAGADGENATDTDAPELETLEESGEILDESMPSLRTVSEYEALWLLDYKVGLTDDYGKETSKQWLEPDATIHRNDVQVVGNFPFDGTTRNYTFEIIYYHPDTERVQTENGTTTKRVANVTGVDTQRVTMDDGFQSTANLSLRSHYDDAEQVVIRVLDDDGGEMAKWGPYTHQSIKTTSGLPFGTWGEFLPWQIVYFLLPAGGGGAIAVGGGMAFAKRTGGFGKGLAWWTLVSGIAGGMALFIYFAEIVGLVVLIPPLLAVPVVFGLFLVTVEKAQPARLARLERPEITETESAIAGSRPSIEHEEADLIHIFERDEGYAFIKHGSISGALARLFASSDADEHPDGEAADDEEDTPPTSVDGMALVPYDRVRKRYAVSGTAPESVEFYIKNYDFTPARWSYSFPPLRKTVETKDGGYVERWRTSFIAGTLVAALFGYLVGAGAFGAGLLGAAVGLVPSLASGLTAHPGHIEIEFADGADISAKAARLTETEERLKYDALDTAIENIVQANKDVWKKLQAITMKTDHERERAISEMEEFETRGDIEALLGTNGSSGESEVVGDGD